MTIKSTYIPTDKTLLVEDLAVKEEYPTAVVEDPKEQSTADKIRNLIK